MMAYRHDYLVQFATPMKISTCNNEQGDRIESTNHITYLKV